MDFVFESTCHESIGDLTCLPTSVTVVASRYKSHSTVPIDVFPLKASRSKSRELWGASLSCRRLYNEGI